LIEPEKLKSPDFQKTFHELEEYYIDELESMLLNLLIEKRCLKIKGDHEETIEFAGRTNYKIRVRRPHKNVWSIPLKDFRESIRKVLRQGMLDPINPKKLESTRFERPSELPTNMVLHILSDEEYERRSFVGNPVVHATLGLGKVVAISESGNVDVKFRDRVATLKPNYVRLKTN
jgi:hypothetical protein